MRKYKGIWFCGLSGSGKSYASNFMSKKISESIKIDGDVVRKFLNSDLGYTKRDRSESARRNFEIAKIMIYEKKFPILSNCYIPQEIVKNAEEYNVKVFKILRRNYVNTKFKENEINILGKDLEFEEFSCSQILNDENFEEKLSNILEQLCIQS